MKIFHPRRRRRPGTLALPTVAVAVVIALLAAACGGDGDGSRPSDSTAAGAETAGNVLREPAGEVGPDPFTTEIGDGDFTDEVAALPASERGAGDTALLAGTTPGLYGGTGDASRCDAEALVAFLDENPDKAEAWAGAIGLESAEIADYVDTLTPRVLLADTRVTNHGFSNGRATPRQSVLQAGTAVLVDVTGVPRTRCACGNPLAPPQITDAEEVTGPTWPDEDEPLVLLPGPVVPIDEVPLADPATDDTVVDDPADADDFCAVWADVEPTIAGGPSGPDDTEAYIVRMQEGFTRLVEAAEQTEGFPPDALADLTQYRDDLLAWSGTGTPGSEDLRDRLEAFLPSYCADRPVTDPDVPDDTDDDSAVDPDVDPAGPVPGPNCGSMQFFLLIYAAEELGVDHGAVSQPYLEAIDDLYAGIDPGAEFDVADLAPMLAVEEVGCEGAQAMYDLLVGAGYEDLIAGTDLEP